MASCSANQGEKSIEELKGKRCRNPFIIWFRERSGSSHLQTILNNHPDIACRGEDFFHSAPVNIPASDDPNEFQFRGNTFIRRIKNRDRNLKPVDRPSTEQIVKHLYFIYSLNRNACGYKLKFPIQVDMYPEVCDELRRLSSELRIIVLHRKNILKQVISRFNMLRIKAAAGACNLHRNAKKAQLDTKLKIDVKRVLGLARHFKEEENTFFEDVKKLQQQTDPLNVLRIDYEDLLADEVGQSQRAFEFLGAAPDSMVKSLYQKATPDNLASVVENFDELAQAVAGTEFEAMLYDNPAVVKLTWPHTTQRQLSLSQRRRAS